MPPPEPTAGTSAARLALARCLAWSLLVAGWLALGALGRQHAPHAAGGLAPVALWLALLGALLAAAARRPWSPRALRRALGAGGGLVAAGACGLAGPPRGSALESLIGPLIGPTLGPLAGPLALALLAAGWALLLVAASLAVRLLRRGATPRPPSPAGPALAGAALAWCATGDSARWLATPLAQGLALAALALLLAALLPRRAAPVAACRAGLFDCALALAPLADWRRPAAWPQAAAALAMLPMMATLTVVADWCGGQGSGSAATATHLAAMLLPALAARAWAASGRSGPPPAVAALATAVLLAAGGLALAWPGLDGLMAAGLLHGLAWGVAWSARWQGSAAAGAPGVPRTGLAAAGPAAAAGALVLALGTAVAAWGPAALAAVHAMLALLGALGAVAVVQRWRAAAVQPPATARAAGLSRSG